MANQTGNMSYANLILKMLGSFNIFSIQGLLVLVGLACITVAFVLFFKYMSMYLIYKKNKMKYLIKKGNTSLLKNVTSMLLKNKTWHKILRMIALKIGMISKYTYDKNLEIATGMIFGGFGIALIIIFTVVPSTNIVWYELVFYLIIALLIITIIFYVFFVFVRGAFIAKLPDVFKILNSRYISKGNILKAIDMSLDDFDKVMRREMMKIYNILKKNDMNEINEAFKEIERTYNTEYLTILLSLIKQAHFKGGNDMIKEQFETITEEMLQEIENQNDITSTGNSYIYMSIAVIPVMKGIEKFNAGAIGQDAVDFYSSQAGKGVLLIGMVGTIFYIGLMLFMERSA